MEIRRFYTSPVNQHNLEAWDELGPQLERRVQDTGSGLSVDVGSQSLFGYGRDAEDVLEVVSALRFSSRNVHIDLWSSIIAHEAVCITFGAGITERERNEIARRLEDNELAGQARLREVEGPYDLDTIQVYGYSFADGIDEDAIGLLLEPFDQPIYIASRNYVVDEKGTIDEQSFDLFSEEKGIATFTVVDPTAERRLWKRAIDGKSEGLIAVYAGDPADEALVNRFSELHDLRILLAEEPSSGMRVTLGRCHADDALVVVYTPGDEPWIDQPLVFAL